MNKLVTLCAVLLVAVAACHLGEAYDFQDVDFNEILSSDFQEIIDSLNEVPLHPRARRDSEAAAADDKCRKRPGGHRGKPRLCCAEQTIDALHETEKEINKACFKEITGNEKPEPPHGPHRRFDLFSCEEVEKRKSEMICIQQCVGQKKGMLDDDGAPRPEEITTILKEKFANEAWFESQVDKIVANCLAEAKNATSTPIKFYTENLKVCNPSGITLKHCLFKEVQLSCPEDQIKDKSSCDKLQERLKKGEIEGPPPPPPPAPFDGPKDD